MRDDNVLDLFAGPGGWDEGVRALGLRPVGVEWDAAACQTAIAAGHVRFQHDVAALDPRDFAGQVFTGPVRGLIASPPCQGFSQAGKQQGRKDAATLLAAIPEMTRRDVRPELRAGMADSRSILVLEPLRWALALTPSWLAWEQVPAVLPIWERCAEVLRRLGYTVAVGNLSSECYGVPQTRKRAILVARAPWMTAAMGPVRLPEATHSRYYPRTPAKLDPGVLPWVSMAQALGWGMTARPYPTIAGGTGGGPDPLAVGGSNARHFIKAEHEAGGDRWVQQSNYSAPPTPEKRTAAERGLGERDVETPSFAVTSKGFHWLRHNQGYRDRPVDETGKARVRNEDGSDYYQRFPTDAPAPSITTQADAWKWDDAELVSQDGEVKRWALRMGTGENATVRAEDEPAPTVHFGERLNSVEWQTRPAEAATDGDWHMTPINPRPNGALRRHDKPAPTMIGGPGTWVDVAGSTAEDVKAAWTAERPATTVQGDPRIANPGHHDKANPQMNNAVRVTIAEAAVLQSFPADYPWRGTKTAQYRQVGDAVPPGLALVVVSEAAGIPVAVAEDGPWPFRKPAPTVLGAMQGVLTKPGQTHHNAMREIRALETEPEDVA